VLIAGFEYGKSHAYIKAKLSARLIDVEKTEILWIGKDTGGGAQEHINNALCETARRIAAANRL
jgi:hypothetical protein